MKKWLWIVAAFFLTTAHAAEQTTAPEVAAAQQRLLAAKKEVEAADAAAVAAVAKDAEDKAKIAKQKTQEADAAVKAAGDANQAAETAAKKTDPMNTDKFWQQWGVGLGVSKKLGPRGSSIDEAQLVNGIVRVTGERDVVPRLMLERHWYFNDDVHPHFRQGLFVGASLFGDKKLLESVSLGWLVAFTPNKGDKSSHNLGVGLSVEPYAKELGDGITANQPLPTGETAIRYKERNRMAITVFYTYTMSQ